MINQGNSRWPLTVAVIVTLPLLIMPDAETLKAAVNKTLTTPQRQGSPFASVLKNQPPATVPFQTMADTAEGYDLSPEMVLEIVDLQYMNPQEASAAFGCMNSERGKIAAQEGGNRVIIFDTRDNVDRIVTSLKEADRPIQALSVKAIALNSIEAKVAASIMAEMASSAGSITVVTNTNTLILCDTRPFVEAMENKLTELDHPTPGLLIVPITLDHMDAKSAMAALENLLSEYGSIVVIERTNTLVLTDLAKNVGSMRDEIKRIDKEVSGLHIETVNLKFLKAENLKLVLDKMVSQYGIISTNPESNSVILCDTRENLARILTEIKKADKTPKQIMIEVVMLDVRLGDDQEIGINWDLMSDNNFYDYIYRQNISADRIGSTVSDATTIGAATAFNSVGAMGGDFSIISGTIRHVVHLLQEKRDVEIIASPRALVMSGKTANVQAIEEIPYQLLSTFQEGGSMATTEFKPVGITLDVTAYLTDQNEIALDISIDLNVRTSESAAGVPVVDTRSESTSLLLNDGQIVVMGGLRRSEKTKQISQIPLIGDLPIVGHLFKGTKNLTVNSELVILISPHIYKGDPVPAAVTEKVRELKQNAPLTGQSRGGKNRQTTAGTVSQADPTDNSIAGLN
jgi:type II secretory pathway component GspD/PulD (secretin)